MDYATGIKSEEMAERLTTMDINELPINIQNELDKIISKRYTWS